MGLRPHASIAELSGWMMLFCCVGIGLRELFPQLSLAVSQWIVLLAGFGVLLVCVHGASRPVQICICIVVALFFGIWRVDIAPNPRVFTMTDGTRMRVVSHATNAWPWGWLTRYRAYVTGRIHAALPEREAVLVSGILYGDGKFSNADAEVFRSAGVMHIVAVSGSNVTVIIECLIVVTSVCRLRRRTSFIVASVLLLLFTGFVGFSASVVRAALMGWLMLLAREVGRIALPFRSLLVVGTTLLLIDPWALRYDIGFMLSFLAMWGVLAWVPLFQLYLRWLPERFLIRTSVAMTLAATLMTAPYLAWVFHRVSLAGLWTNILILPLVPFVMLWGAIVMVVGSGPFGLFALPVVGLTRCIFAFARTAELIPWMDVKHLSVSAFIVCAVYTCIVYLWIVFGRNITYQQGDHTI